MTYDVPLLVINAETEVSEGTQKKNLQKVDFVQSPCSKDTGSYVIKDPITEEQQLLPYTIVMEWRRLPKAIRLNNKLVLRYKAPCITEYLDVETGEIIHASILRNDPRVPSQIHLGEILLLRQALLDSLRREVRQFALFVLCFRNNRRGITPGIETLVEWYARLHGKRPSNVRRYVAVLEDKGLLAGSSLLSRLFQRTGNRALANEHLGEDVEARRKYFALRFRAGKDAVSFS